jgi:hypothetical protein
VATRKGRLYRYPFADGDLVHNSKCALTARHLEKSSKSHARA